MDLNRVLYKSENAVTNIQTQNTNSVMSALGYGAPMKKRKKLVNTARILFDGFIM